MSHAEAAHPILPPDQSLCRRHRPARRHPAAFPDSPPLADRARLCRRLLLALCCSSR